MNFKSKVFKTYLGLWVTCIILASCTEQRDVEPKTVNELLEFLKDSTLNAERTIIQSTGKTKKETGTTSKTLNYTNLALSGTVSASTTYPGYSANNVNDGETNTIVGGAYSWTNYYHNRGTLPQYLTISFESIINFNEIHLYTSENYELKDYVIQIKNYQGNWVDIFQKTGNTDIHNIHTSVNEISTDTLRVKCNLGPNSQYIYTRINEIEIYNTNIAGGNHGKLYAPENSGQLITSKSYKDFKLYQSHSSWSPDGRWLIFTSWRDKNRNNFFAMNMPGTNDGVTDYQIIQLTDHSGVREINGAGASTEDLVISQQLNDKNGDGVDDYYLYYLLESNGQVIVVELDYGKLINDALNGTVGATWKYDRLVATWTSGSPTISGGLSLDASEDYVYVGLNFGGTTFYLQKVNISTGAKTNLHTNTGFSISHIIANPYISNRVIFSHSSGKTPYNYTPSQRMYYYNGSSVSPLFDQQSGDNVSHETWLNSNTIGFNLTSTLRQVGGVYQTGVWKVDVTRGNASKITEHSSRRYIHHVGTNNGNTIYGDLMYGGTPEKPAATDQIWKFDTSTGTSTLIHNESLGTHAHHSISPDGNWMLFQQRSGADNLKMIPLN